MSSYTFGDDVLLGSMFSNFLKKTVVGKIVSAPVKFIAHPIKETKAAVKTITRFDPTSSTAKYGTIGKMALGVGAVALTAGIAVPLIGQALTTPVRIPPKTIAPEIPVSSTSTPINTFTETQAPQAQTEMSRPADQQIAETYATTDKPKTSNKSAIIMIAALIATAGVITMMGTSKRSVV